MGRELLISLKSYYKGRKSFKALKKREILKMLGSKTYRDYLCRMAGIPIEKSIFQKIVDYVKSIYFSIVEKYRKKNNIELMLDKFNIVHNYSLSYKLERMKALGLKLAPIDDKNYNYEDARVMKLMVEENISYGKELDDYLKDSDEYQQLKINHQQLIDTMSQENFFKRDE